MKNNQDKTREELLQELHELKHECDTLKALYERDVQELINAKLLIDQAKERAEDRESKLLGMIDTLQDAFFQADINGNFTYVNSTAAEQYGYSCADEMIGMSASMLYADAEERGKMLEELSKNGKITNYLGKGLRKDGSIFWVLMNVKFIRDKEQNIVGAEGVVRDISERIHAEEARIETDELFKHIFDGANVGKSITSPDGEIQVNKAFCELLGYSEVELKNKNWKEITHHDDIEITQIEINKIISGQSENVRFDKRYIHKNGSEIWVDLSTSALRAKDGTLKKFITTIVDITEQKQVEIALIKSEAQFRSTFDLSPVGSVIVGLDKKFIRCNNAFCAFLGYEEDELIGKTISEITFPDDIELGMTEMRALVEGKINQSSIQKRYLRKDGTVVWGEISICLVSDEKKQPLYFLPIIQDINERKQAEKLLIESEERFQLLFNKAPLGYQSLDFDGYFIDINQQWLDTLGYERNEVVGKWFGDFLTPTYKDGFRQRFPIFKEQGHIHSEFEMIHKNGNVLFIAFDGKIGYDSHGDFKQTHCILQDITERKLVETKLKESKELYSAVYKAIPVPTYTWKAVEKDLVLIEFNDAAYEITSGKITEFIGKNAKTIYYENQKILDNLYSCLLEKNSFEIEMDYYFQSIKQNKILNVKYAFAPPDLVIVHTEDITERRRAEDEIIYQRNTLNAIFESSPFLLMLLDKNGRVIKINKLGEAFAAEENGSIIDRLCGEVFNCINNSEEVMCGENENCGQCAIRNSLDQTYQSGISIINCEGTLKRRKAGVLEVLNVILSTSVVEQKGEKIVLVSIVDVTEIKKAEDLLKINNERLELAMHSANMAWWEMDIETGNVNFEKRKVEILGYKPENFKHYKDFMALVHVDDFEKAMEAMRLHIAGKKDRYEVEYRILCNSGEYKWFYDIGTIVKSDLDGNPLRVTGLAVDISERKFADETLYKSKERYSKLLENVETGIVVHAPDTSIILNNARASELLGLSDNQMRGKKAIDPDWRFVDEGGNALPLDDYPVNRIVNTKQPFRNHIIGVKQPHKNDIVWLLINGLPILNSQGEITEILISFIDITELKSISEVQEFLIHCGHSSSGEEFFESLAKFLSQHLSMSYVCIDRLEGDGLTAQTLAIYNGGEYESNVSYALKETPCGDVVGKTICCFPENVCELFPNDQALQDLNAASYIGTTLWSFDGKAIGLIALIDQKPIRDVKLAEAVLKLVAVRASAELERKQAELELVKARDKAQESDRLKTAFLQNMSHEIRTPMNGILGFSYLLSQPGLNSDKQQEYISIIKKSGDRMINVLNEIMDISKIESGLVEAIISDVNVNEKVKSVYDILKLEAVAKSIRFSFETSLPESAAIIKTDGEKLFGILSNLAKNAIKYSEVGSIEIGYYKKGDTLEFYVKDTGIGIHKDRQEAIFDRFIQADIEDVQARQGAGLGLSISKAFVELLGGIIWVESVLGKGSTFYFTLPYLQDISKRETFDSLTSFVNEEKELKKLKILIVEDDEVSELLFSNYVQEFVKQLLSARNGSEAVDTFRKNPNIDLILMDMSMPVMNGYDATRIIRKLNKDVIIIGLTAFAQDTDLKNAVGSGCNECIAKPVSKDHLMELIRTYFEFV